MAIFPAYICLCTMCMPSVHRGRKGNWIPWNWGTDSCVLLCGGCELNTSSLQEQPVFSTAESTLELYYFFK